jgi:hypothetical protein
MTGTERLDSKAGPLGNLYFGGLDWMARGCEPALKGVGRWNLELVGLATRRSQAWLDVPSRLMQCKTPIDLVNEQIRFWQAAVSDYTEGSRRLSAAWGACAAMPKLNGTQPRDYMTFAEPNEAAKRADRRAA